MSTAVDTILNVGDNQEIPDMGQLMSASAREAGINFTVNTTPQGDFYDRLLVPAASGEDSTDVPCFNSTTSSESSTGVTGRRPIVFLTSGMQSGAIWNGSSYQNAEYDALVTAIPRVRRCRCAEGGDRQDPEALVGGSSGLVPELHRPPRGPRATGAGRLENCARPGPPCGALRWSDSSNQHVDALGWGHN